MLSRLGKKLRKLIEENQMAKNTRKKGKSVRNGNAPSPYNKYKKQAYQYGESYKNNYLLNGILHRNGKPVYHEDKHKMMAAE